MKRVTIYGDLAHFKVPSHSKIQRTFTIPPISTVIGMLKNIYGKDIDDFLVGYTMEYDFITNEVITIYKEVNPNAKNKKSDLGTKDIIYVENLVNPILTIYTDIDNEIEFDEPLCFGKANYLAKLVVENVELVSGGNAGFNQYTPTNIGDGVIKRVNTETKYNGKGYYDYKSTLLRECKEFSYDKNLDVESGNNIVLWRWKDGDIIET